jgi:hypothetical protein
MQRGGPPFVLGERSDLQKLESFFFFFIFFYPRFSSCLCRVHLKPG